MYLSMTTITLNKQFDDVILGGNRWYLKNKPAR